MASSTTITPAAADPFKLGIHTPVPWRMAQTPSSPLIAVTTAATEGAARAIPSSIFGTQPISIIESPNDLAR
ncbi:hypothetical protein BFJ63_vAg18468 [Fusarium oxysporum f. sp. narcissi]|uniref:Uncharacterized protein n=1 Tax=Fusarium oxysporum f. sp. narcissi TaxID=451672 RepID=A0A4Q2UY92_FUSOX|nr:hypothetical protein BFJ63_vAg18468 [Fusarium oxysporum f. sp. narcissi]